VLHREGCCCDRVVADERCAGTARVDQWWREREGFPHQTSHPLPQRVLAVLEMMGCAGWLREGSVWRRGHAPLLDVIGGRMARHLGTGHQRQLGPERRAARATALWARPRHALAGERLPSAPAPRGGRWLRPAAPQRIGWRCQGDSRPAGGRAGGETGQAAGQAVQQATLQGKRHGRRPPTVRPIPRRERRSRRRGAIRRCGSGARRRSLAAAVTGRPHVGPR
jgi:hypothetical protein